MEALIWFVVCFLLSSFWTAFVFRRGYRKGAKAVLEEWRFMLDVSVSLENEKEAIERIDEVTDTRQLR